MAVIPLPALSKLLLPSRSQTALTMAPSGSVPPAVNVTGSRLRGAFGSALMLGAGARLITLIVTSWTSKSPSLSTAFRRMTWGPGTGYVFRISTFDPSSKLPSLSRSHAIDAIDAVGVVDVDVNLTSVPLSGLDDDVVKFATGAAFPPIMI